VASLIDSPVVLSSADEAVATGAAVQACAVLEQVDHSVIQDRWGLGAGANVDPIIAPDTTTRARYAALRDASQSHG
jgi:xylulokinase